MQKNVTIWDIAKRAGVGISTVSRVLNGSAGVNEATQERVRAAIAEYGYAPNNNARQLKQRQADAVSVIVRGTAVCRDCGHEWPNTDRFIRRHVSDGSSVYLGCYEGKGGRYHLYSTTCSQCGYEYTYTVPCGIH